MSTYSPFTKFRRVRMGRSSQIGDSPTTATNRHETSRRAAPVACGREFVGCSFAPLRHRLSGAVVLVRHPARPIATTTGARVRSRRRRRHRRRRVHRPMDRLLPRQDRPEHPGRRARARDRRLRGVGPQRRLVLGPVRDVLPRSSSAPTAARPRRRSAKPSRRRSTRWARWRPPRPSTATFERAAR